MKVVKSLLAVCLVTAVVGCGQGTPGSSEETSKIPGGVITIYDYIKPQVSLPQDATVPVGKYALTAQADDNVAVARVELWKDGTLISADTVPPYEWTFRYHPWEVGQRRTYVAKAVDTNANEAWSNPHQVTIVPRSP